MDAYLTVISLLRLILKVRCVVVVVVVRPILLVTTLSSVQRRKLKLKANVESCSTCFSFKRWNQARFNLRSC